MSDHNDERTRYSAEELVEFEELIQSKLETARAELRQMQEEIRSHNSGNSDAFNVTEFSSEVADKENMEMLMNRQLKFVDSLERAMIRIKNGTYGRCKVTGKLIPKERLRVVPHTETSIEAKLNQ
jgi:RNA polymerase-binding transcription factor DksA